MEAEPSAPAPRRNLPFSASGAWNAFKNVAIVFSFVVNLVLLVVLLLVMPKATGVYEPVRNEMLAPIVSGLHEGFGKLNDARIQRTIEVHDTVPAVFDLPLNQSTVVELTEPVPLVLPAIVDLGNGNQLNSTVYLSLPPQTKLPVHMAMTVPVSQTIPVNLKVAVDIPLSETELGPQFLRFQTLFAGLNDMVKNMPDTWDGVVECTLKGGVVINCSQK